MVNHKRRTVDGHPRSFLSRLRNDRGGNVLAIAAACNRAGAVLSEMLAIARSMLEHTREIEHQMVRSEKETRVLHRSLEDARRSAEIDHLTGLPNRRAFETRIEKEVVAARAAGEPLCVAFCDIDRFKKINDTHGHEAGDRVLKVVAHALN